MSFVWAGFLHWYLSLVSCDVCLETVGAHNAGRVEREPAFAITLFAVFCGGMVSFMVQGMAC